MVKRRKKKHIRSTPEREKRTKAMKAIWQMNHSRKSVTEFWSDYLQNLATESASEEKKDSVSGPAAAEVEETARREVFLPKRGRPNRDNA